MFKSLFRKLRKNEQLGFRASWAHDISMRAGPNQEFMAFTAGSASKKKVDRRKKVKPKDVVNDLLGVKPEIDLSNLTQKIVAISNRRRFMKNDLQVETLEEDQALTWLKARKKAISKKIMNDFDWPVTTEEKIEKLLAKYKLTMGSLQGYHLAVPAEAITELEKYTKLYQKVSSEKPEIMIIADEITAKKVERKRKDPIILATSPFGRFFHVIGAWDKEVEIMHELFFKNK